MTEIDSELNAIEPVIKAFLPKSKPSIISSHSGEINRVVIFSDRGSYYALRIKKKPFPENSLIFEKNFLDALGNFDLPIAVPKIFLSETGHTFVRDSSNQYTLMSCVPGSQRFKVWYECHLFSLDDLSQGFRILGALHNAYRQVQIENIKKSPTVFNLLDTFKASFSEPAIQKGEFEETIINNSKFLLETIEYVRWTLESENYKKLPLFPVHYDINYTNVLWEGKKIVSLIDFDWAQFSTLEFDFAQMCKLTCGGFKAGGSKTNLFEQSRLRTALGSYNKNADIPFENLKLMAALLDVSSLFISNWAIETFKIEKVREAYLLSVFQSGLDRLRNPVKF